METLLSTDNGTRAERRINIDALVPTITLSIRKDMKKVDDSLVYGEAIMQMRRDFQNKRLFEREIDWTNFKTELSEHMSKFETDGNLVGVIRMGIEMALNEFCQKHYGPCLDLLKTMDKRTNLLPTTNALEEEQKHELEMTINFARLMCHIDLRNLQNVQEILKKLKPIVESSRSWSDHWRYWSNCGGFYLQYLTVSNMRSQCPREVTRRIAGFYEKAAEAVQGMVDVGNNLRTSFRCGPTLDAAKVYLDMQDKSIMASPSNIEAVDLDRANYLLFTAMDAILSCPTNRDHWPDPCRATLSFLRGLYFFRKHQLSDIGHNGRREQGHDQLDSNDLTEAIRWFDDIMDIGGDIHEKRLAAECRDLLRKRRNQQQPKIVTEPASDYESSSSGFFGGTSTDSNADNEPC